MKNVYFFILLKFIICDNNKQINKKKLIIHNFNESAKSITSSYNSNGKRNVILSVIQNYSIDMILPFINSIFYVNFDNCDIVIFVRKVSKKLIKYLKSNGVFIFEIPEEYNNISIINVRWKMYIDFLKKYKGKYNLIFHADIRDTFFQKDIFKYYENYNSFLGIAIEDGFLIEELNKKWIIDFVGIEKYKIIKNERIICIGTVWGTLDKFLEFSIIFWSYLLLKATSIEQGICNYLFYYEKLFENYIVKSDNFGPVMTIGLTERNNIKIDYKKNILNFKGEIAAVIHQYDRKPDIAIIVKNKYTKLVERNIISFMIFLQLFTLTLSFRIMHSLFKFGKLKKNLNIWSVR